MSLVYLSPNILSMGLGAGRLGDGRCWVQVGRRSLVAGVDISRGQEKWEQGRRQSIVRDES